MLIAGVLGFLLTLHWVRSRDLREKYAAGWLFIAGIVLLSGLFPKWIMTLADAAKLSYPAAVLLAALVVIYGFGFSVSVTLTRLHRRNHRLLQEIALLEERLQLLEQEQAAARDPKTEFAQS